VNRHERRRTAARQARFFATVEVLDHEQLSEMAGQQAGLSSTFIAFVEAMVTARPPQCATCSAPLTMSKPPRLWAIYTRLDGGQARLAGLCAACSQSDDVAWRAARAAGMHDLRPLPLQGGTREFR
jgi:hypothetical protein